MRRLLLIFSFAAAMLYVAHDRILPPIAHWLDVGEPPAKLDYVMVLPGDPSIRPYVAAGWITTGLADRALVTPTRATPEVQEGNERPTAETERKVLLHRGVKEDQIITLGGESDSTMSDIQALSEFMDQQTDVRIGVVTSAFHTRRARWTLSNSLGPRAERIQMISAPNPGFDADQWWRSPMGCNYILSEYLKTIYYFMRYGNGIWWSLGIFAGIIAFRSRPRSTATEES